MRDNEVAAGMERRFWAGLLGSTVQSDGCVPGFDRWWNSTHNDLRDYLLRQGRALGRKATELPLTDEEVGREVASARAAIRGFRPSPDIAVDPDEVRRMVSAIGGQLKWRE